MQRPTTPVRETRKRSLSGSPSSSSSNSPLLSPKRPTKIIKEDLDISGQICESLNALMNTVCIQEVIERQISTGLIRATANESVGQVCKRLADHTISSLPIFAQDDEDKVIGVVDFSDLSAHVLNLIRDTNSISKLIDGNDFVDEAGSAPISEVIDLSHRNPLVVISSTATLIDAARAFTEKHLRRILVVSGNNPETNKPYLGEEIATARGVCAILAPSALMRFIITRLSKETNSSFEKTVDELKIGSKPVISIHKSQTVLEALDTMFHSKISVIAVTDDATHALVGNISMSDIRHLFKKRRFSTLIESCWDCIVQTRADSLAETFPFYAVRGTTTLRSVVGKLLATHVHHLYVVDSATLLPLKVISFADILSAVVRDVASMDVEKSVPSESSERSGTTA